MEQSAEAQAALAIAYLVSISYIPGTAAESMRLGEVAALKALELAPSLADGHLMARMNLEP